MNGKYFSLIAALAIATVACSEKGNTDSANDSNIKNFEIGIVEKSLSANYLCVGDTTFGAETKLYTVSQSTLQWPVNLGESNIKGLQDTLMIRCFGDSLKAGIDKAMLEYAANPVIMDESCELEAVDSVPPVDNTGIRLLEQTVSVKAVNVNSRYAVFEIYHYMYGGGAHPIYSSSFVNFDVKQGKVLTFDDIIMSDKKDDLVAAIKDSLRGRYDADSDEQLQETSGINLDAIGYALESPNFYFNDYGIVFYFNPYEIGPWAIGAVEVPVSAYAIGGIIKPEAKCLMNSC